MSSKIIKIEALVLNQSDPKLFSDAMEDNFGFEFDRNQFIIDGFIDRYTGDKLLNPGMLKIISHYFLFAYKLVVLITS